MKKKKYIFSTKIIKDKNTPTQTWIRVLVKIENNGIEALLKMTMMIVPVQQPIDCDAPFFLFHHHFTSPHSGLLFPKCSKTHTLTKRKQRKSKIYLQILARLQSSKSFLLSFFLSFFLVYKGEIFLEIVSHPMFQNSSADMYYQTTSS